MSIQSPDAYLVQAVVNDDKVWEHRWYVPRWGDPDPSELHGTTYTIRGKEHPELGTYRVTPFYAAPPAQGVDPVPLWKFQTAVDAMRSDAESWAYPQQRLAACDELQALIDSQRDAGAGVEDGK